MIKHKIKIFSKVSIVFILAFSFILTDSNVALAATAPTLGVASTFAVLAGSGITFAGAVNSSTIKGDIGTYSTTTITGLEKVVLNGTNHAGDGVTQTAKTDLTTAYLNAESQAPATTTYPAIHDLGGETLSPGIYKDPSSFGITGTLTLDGGGNSNAVFVFQAGSTLITAGSSIVSLTNGTQARNVFWQVGSSATLGTSSTFKGNILALESITLTTSANVEGRMLARNGAVTLDTNTITVPTTLTLNKTVTNDNGGTALNTAWTLAATGPTPISGATGNVSVTNVAVDSGAYTLSESGGPAGYNASTYSCVTNGGAPVSNNSITLAAGDNAVCTITNDDIAPQLHLRKVITNDNGGTATAANFTLTANGTGSNDISGTSPVDSDAGLLADTFALSETSPGGYTASAWVCVGGTQVGSNITVGVDQSATCTITNDDIAPSLTLDKVVVNDNSGVSIESDWTLTASGPTSISGPGAVGATDVVSGATFLAGTYTLSESAGPAGYAASSWSCVKNAGAPVISASIILGLGDTAVCTITNDDIAPGATILNIIKHVINDNSGTKSAGDFVITIGGVTADGGNIVTGTESPGINKTLSTVGAYTITETELAGYSQSSSANCSGTIALGETKTCTITNDDIAEEDDDEEDNSDVDIKVKKTASDYKLNSGPKKVTFTYKVTNEGDSALTDISVKDDECDDVNYKSGDDDDDDELDTDEEWKYTCKKTIKKTETNKVTAKGTANGEEVKDTDTAKVTVSTPGLPNAGFDLEGQGNSFWNIILAFLLF
jgi:hypothetical protein